MSELRTSEAFQTLKAESRASIQERVQSFLDLRDEGLILASNKAVARGHARAVCARVRNQVADLVKITSKAGDQDAAAMLYLAQEMLTECMSATYDGPEHQVFACNRGSVDSKPAKIHQLDARKKK